MLVSSLTTRKILSSLLMRRFTSMVEQALMANPLTHRIHEAVDSAIQQMDLNPTQLAEQAQAEAIEGNLFAAIRRQVLESAAGDRIHCICLRHGLGCI